MTPDQMNSAAKDQNGLDRREEQLRRSFIDMTHRLANGAWASGSKLAIAARDREGHGVDSDEHADRLLVDLIALGLVEEKPVEPTGGFGRRELRHRQFRLTDLGWRLRVGDIDAMPGIADRRSE